MYTQRETLQGIYNTNMTDIFDTKILCQKCNVQMDKTLVDKEGCEVRAVKCPNCGDKIIHPADINSLDHYNTLKGKTFHVKLRMVGNSHAISIPKEIVDFMTEQHKSARRRMDEMVRLCFEDFRRLSLSFDEDDDFDDREVENYANDDEMERNNMLMRRIKMKKLNKSEREY